MHSSDIVFIFGNVLHVLAAQAVILGEAYCLPEDDSLSTRN